MRLITVFLLATLTLSPTFAKTGRTYYTEAKLAAAMDKVKQFGWAKASVTGAEAAASKWTAMSDQELWDFVPPPGQLRALNTCFGVDCPVHGAEIFRKGGHYPWITSDDRPFKVKCPVGGEEYPSNDFKPWNPNSIKEEPQKGPGYVDNGAGWVNDKGQRFYFVGYYVFWHRWQGDEHFWDSLYAQDAVATSGAWTDSHQLLNAFFRFEIDQKEVRDAAAFIHAEGRVPSRSIHPILGR